MLAALTVLLPGAANALEVNDNGMPTYSQPIAVPPGVAGLAPQLGLMFSSGGNGAPGAGWAIQGLSAISRCPGTKALDGKLVPVTFGVDDRLCLDGQRLIRVDPSTGLALSTQGGDATGLASGFREYRTEKDSFARIRAYGQATSGDAASGPGYFRVWTKAGQIFDYGATPGGVGGSALVLAQGSSTAMVWAVGRLSDVSGNFIDYKYEQGAPVWGSSNSINLPGNGRTWKIREIQYGLNKVVFGYAPRPSTALPRDASESYHHGVKNVDVDLLKTITTYVNAPSTTMGDVSGAIAVKTLKLDQQTNPKNGRSRLQKITECAGDASSTRCLPATEFTYTDGYDAARGEVSAFNLKRERLASVNGQYGVLVGDFNVDGKSDLLRWSQTTTENKLWLSQGDGSFQPGTLTIGGTARPLQTPDGCTTSLVADVNGDGIPDIVRIDHTTNAAGAACARASGGEFLINDGNGNFTPRALTLPSGAAIPFARRKAKTTTQTYCGQSAALGPKLAEGTWYDGGLLALGGGDPFCQENPRVGQGWTPGATYYLIDMDGDGRLDIVTTTLAEALPEDPQAGATPPEERVQCTGCTRVFLQRTDGSFIEKTDASIVNQAVYSPPGGMGSSDNVRDVDADGLADLTFVGVPGWLSTWRSLGNGNFVMTPNDQGCSRPLDFNGDGRPDCLYPGNTGTTNMLAAGMGDGTYRYASGFSIPDGLSTNYAEVVSQNFNFLVLDLNGDGKDDVLRWHDSPGNNRIYLSNGDGTFTSSTSLGDMAGLQLQHSDGTYELVPGDFRGNGVIELLRISKNAPDLTAANTDNKLLGVSDARPAELLVAVKGGNGLSTSVIYGAMTASDGRYVSDRGNAAKQAVWPIIDVALPGWVAITLSSQTTVSGRPSVVEHAYAGMKAEVAGRGGLGFREVRRSTQGADGGWITTVTESLLANPYLGAPAVSETRTGAWNATGLVLSRSVNTYCHMDTTQAQRDAAAASGAHCVLDPTTKISRPFQLRSAQVSNDLNGAPLPTIEIRNGYNDRFDLVRIDTTTTGTMTRGLAQTFIKTVVNDYDYQAANTACSSDTSCKWQLSRLSRSTITNTVPNSLASLPTDAGPAPNASATSGARPGNLPVPPAVMSVILNLLLED
ncbi:hypothetical protein ABE85_08620 [Mitsuaria sp. 7]|nr:hypothetical protein ABE85_08620 [Mitsuaria sp. 7]